MVRNLIHNRRTFQKSVTELAQFRVQGSKVFWYFYCFSGEFCVHWTTEKFLLLGQSKYQHWCGWCMVIYMRQEWLLPWSMWQLQLYISSLKYIYLVKCLKLSTREKLGAMAGYMCVKKSEMAECGNRYVLLFLNFALIERSLAGDTWEVNKEALSVNSSPAIAARDELEFTKKKTSAMIHCF